MKKLLRFLVGPAALIVILQLTPAIQGQILDQASPNFIIPPADLALMKALDSKMKFSPKFTPMGKVLVLLEEETMGNLNIVIDSQGFKDELIDEPVFLNDPVTKNPGPPKKVRAILKMILGERPPGFAYYIEDGNLHITPAFKANTKLVPRNYPVSHLVGGEKLVKAAIAEMQTAKQGAKGEIIVGPNGQLLKQNIDGLANLIKGNVEPDHWKTAAGGGPGTMTFVPASASLQINCSLEVHYLLIASGLLGNSPTAVKPPLKEEQTTIKVYDISGLLDPRDLNSSKAELLDALTVLGVKTEKADKASDSAASIMTRSQLLVVREKLEVHARIKFLLHGRGDVGKLDDVGQIVVLNLSESRVTDAGLKELAEFKSLEILNLHRAQATDEGLKELAGLKSLKSLNLSGTAVTGSGLKELSGLNSMQSLNLADTRLTDVGLREVAGLKSLQFLSLRGTQITDSGLRELAKLKSLRTLCLTGTSPKDAANNDPLRFLVTDSGVAELRKALPGLRIIR